MEIDMWTYRNWETDQTKPMTARFQPVVRFLGYDPSPEPTTLAERLDAKRRALGVTLVQVARHLGWDEGTLQRYLNGTWRMPPARAKALEGFLARDERSAGALARLPRRLRP